VVNAARVLFVPSNGGQECKTGHDKEKILMGRGGEVKKGKESEYGQVEYGTLKPIKVILRRGREKSKNNEGDEPNQGTLYAHVGTSQ
jgi:hypothetical protein